MLPEGGASSNRRRSARVTIKAWMCGLGLSKQPAQHGSGGGALFRLLRRADHAAAEQVDERLLRHRLGEQIALADIAADALQLMALVGALDAFGHGLELEALGQLDDGLAQPGVDLVDMAIGDVG